MSISHVKLEPKKLATYGICPIFKLATYLYVAEDTMCKSGTMFMPRSLTLGVGSIYGPFSVVYWKNSHVKGSSWRNLDFPVVWHRYSNLSLCSVMLFSRDQRTASLRSDCNRVTSLVFWISFSNRVSSAKLLMTECLITFVRSLRYRINRTGPSTVPWGTPLLTVAG